MLSACKGEHLLLKVWSMRIGHVGYGSGEIPPKGWGAVEALIWDYKFHLEKLGHEFEIVNTREPQEVIEKVNSLSLDVVHVHNDLFFPVMPYLNVPVRILCTHDANVTARNLATGHPQLVLYRKIMLEEDFFICCLSDRIKGSFARLGVTRARLFLAKNGARADLFRFNETAELPDRSVCVGAVSERKRQYLLSWLDWIDFVGPKQDKRFNYSTPNYLGQWSREFLYSNLTRYANLVLLSESEAAPLVVREALMAGLGVVVSEAAAVDLDRKQPFIEIIPERRVRDKDYVAAAVKNNQRIAVKSRQTIRRYAVEHFDWSRLIKEYDRNVAVFLKNVQRSCTSEC
jgi:hypothetical protein